MAKSQGQKMKILRLMELFYKETDPEHPLSMQDIVDYLIGQGHVRRDRRHVGERLYPDVAGGGGGDDQDLQGRDVRGGA